MDGLFVTEIGAQPIGAHALGAQRGHGRLEPRRVRCHQRESSAELTELLGQREAETATSPGNQHCKLRPVHGFLLNPAWICFAIRMAFMPMHWQDAHPMTDLTPSYLAKNVR